MTQDILNLKPVFSSIYGKAQETIDFQVKRYSELADFYQEKFSEKELQYFSTPGRTEIGGNHTDHNHGVVLAASIDLDSIAIASKTSENKIVLYSL